MNQQLKDKVKEYETLTKEYDTLVTKIEHEQDLLQQVCIPHKQQIESLREIASSNNPHTILKRVIDDLNIATTKLVSKKTIIFAGKTEPYGYHKVIAISPIGIANGEQWRRDSNASYLARCGDHKTALLGYVEVFTKFGEQLLNSIPSRDKKEIMEDILKYAPLLEGLYTRIEPTYLSHTFTAPIQIEYLLKESSYKHPDAFTISTTSIREIKLDLSSRTPSLTLTYESSGRNRTIHLNTTELNYNGLRPTKLDIDEETMLDSLFENEEFTNNLYAILDKGIKNIKQMSEKAEQIITALAPYTFIKKIKAQEK
jgi:hypothetical protein